jgi:hypothetical protein
MTIFSSLEHDPLPNWGSAFYVMLPSTFPPDHTASRFSRNSGYKVLWSTSLQTIVGYAVTIGSYPFKKEIKCRALLFPSQYSQ